MSYEALGSCLFVFSSVSNRHITQKMRDEVVSKRSIILKCCLDRYKTEEMCDKAVDSYLLALKFVPNWVVTNRMIDKPDNDVFSNDNIIFSDIDFYIVTFFRSDKGLNSITHNNINLDHDNP